MLAYQFVKQIFSLSTALWKKMPRRSLPEATVCLCARLRNDQQTALSIGSN